MGGVSDRDKRMLQRLSERLELFSKGKTQLAVLIADVEFLGGNIESITLQESVLKQGMVLEEVYAIALDRGEAALDASSRKLVENAVVALRELAVR